MVDDEEIQGPPEADNYNGPYGLKPGVSNIFRILLQYIFKCNEMNQYFLQIIYSHRNNYTTRYMAEINSTLYLGQKWTNITVGEKIIFFGIMLRISITTQKMVGYVSYFLDDPMIHLCHSFAVQIRGYGVWDKR